jgi:hypothetical protein
MRKIKEIERADSTLVPKVEFAKEKVGQVIGDPAADHQS